MDSILDKLYAGQDLDFDEARRAMGELMAGRASEAETAAFLVSLKIKGEAPSEIAGAARAMQDAAVPVRAGAEPLLDTCGTGGDGHHTINVSTASALLLAAAGVTVAKHGNRAVSSRSGSADVLEELGVVITLGPEANAKLLDEVGIAFMFAPAYHTAMKNVMPVRQALKTRTIFNLVGPLCNPARPTAQVLGVFSEELLKPMALALKDLGIARAFVVHGSGLDEIGLHGPTSVVEVFRGQTREFTVDPAALGVEPAAIRELKGGDAAENARKLRDILGGRDRGAGMRAVALNAAAGLILAGRQSDWRDAYNGACHLLAAGAGERLLDRWVEASKDLT